MHPMIKKIDTILSWIIFPGLLYFFVILLEEGQYFHLFLRGKLLGISLFVIISQVILLIFILRNFELVLISFLTVLCSFLITAGVAVSYELAEGIGLYWVVIYCSQGVIGIYVITSLHKQTNISKLPSLFNQTIYSLFLFISGILLLLLPDRPFIRIAGFFLAGLSITLIYIACLQVRSYAVFFSIRIERGKWPLTIVSIIHTLLTYFILVMGSIVVGILGAIVYACFFINLERRKTIFHYMLYYYSHFYVWSMPLKAKRINSSNETFEVPAVIISNHQSLIDTPMMFSLCPKNIILVNDWVYRSPIFGHISKMADFFNVTTGIDSILEKIRERVNEGYSILVFPEGTRSKTGKIQRFHRGAFYIAEQLNLDIVPSVICGTQKILEKGEFWGRGGRGYHTRQLILPRIPISDTRYGETYSKRAKGIRKYLTHEYEKLEKELKISDGI
jgi:1-acyl-sn-glycerol-3-phosphate acyltransferase